MLWVIQDSKGLHYNWIAMHNAVLQIESNAIFCALGDVPALLDRVNIIIGGDDFLDDMMQYNTDQHRMMIFNFDWLNVPSYKKIWNDEYLNYGTRDTCYSYLFKLPTKEYYIRPTDDSKCIDGAVYSLPDDLEKFTACRNCRKANSSCICIGPPYRVYAEWRFVIINCKIVSGCQYCKNGENCVSASIPNRVISFVSHIVERTSENGPYVLDIADTDVGLKVLEANIFNASNFYVCNRTAIALAIEEYVEKIPIF